MARRLGLVGAIAALCGVLLLPPTAGAADPPPEIAGRWSAPVTLPVIAVHASLLPSGRVLLWDSVNDDFEDLVSGWRGPVQGSTRAVLWDPSANSSVAVPSRNSINLFCSAHAQLPNGDLAVVGGNEWGGAQGLSATMVFDSAANRWTRGREMGAARYYPSLVPLPNGETLVAEGTGNTTGPDAGDPIVPEIRGRSGEWRGLPGARMSDIWSATDGTVNWYPMMHAGPGGKVFYVGPINRLHALDPTGGGTWQDIGARDGVLRRYGSAAMYQPGRIIVAGGGPGAAAPESSAVVVDLDSRTAAPTGALRHRRQLHNLTVLADGSVLATGGNTSPNQWLHDTPSGVLTPELWNPATGTWTEMSAMARTRQYHSTALLLPDGRVMSAGGGYCGFFCNAGGSPDNGHKDYTAEIFTPPYLYKRDGSGQPAARPVIASAPGSVPYGGTFAVETPQAGGIAKLALVRLGSVSHSTNFDQRYVPLSFSASGDGLRVRAPAPGDAAPPGNYMLFLIDQQGVPSISRIVRLRSTASDVTGDGMADLVAWNDDTTYAMASTGARNHGFLAPRLALSPRAPFFGDKATLAADVNGDGKDDLVAVNGGSTWVMAASGAGGFSRPRSWSSQPFHGTRATLAGDVTGEGRDDLIAWNDDTLYVAKANPTGLHAPESWGGAPFHGNKANVVGDVNGDGRADLVAWNDTSTYVRHSTGGSFGAIRQWSGGAFHGSLANVVAEVNGDGRDDLVAWNETSTFVRFSQGSAVDAGFSAPVQGSVGAFHGTRRNLVADVNGDGRDDLVAVNDASTFVMLSTGQGFAAPVRWSDVPFYGSIVTLAADVNGDRFDDLVAVNGTGQNGGEQWLMLSTGRQTAPFEAPRAMSGQAFSGDQANLAADVSGDGKTDLIAWSAASTSVRRSSGTAFGAVEQWSTGAFTGSRARASGDFNGDGRSDLIAWDDAKTTVRLSTGSSFGPASAWSDTPFAGERANLVGDFDGDGRSDIVAWNGAAIDVRRSNGAAFSGPERWSSEAISAEREHLAADVDGDGRTDLVAWNDASTRVLLSTGSSFRAARQWSSVAFFGSRRNAAGDVNGDGRADLVAWNGSDTYVMLSTGTSFSRPEQWSAVPFFGTRASIVA